MFLLKREFGPAFARRRDVFQYKKVKQVQKAFKKQCMKKWVSAHNQAIMALQTIYGENATCIHEFYKKLLSHV